MSALRRPIVWGILAGLTLLVLARSLVIGVYRVPTVSMAPTLLRGDWLLVDRWNSAELRRGDIIVFDRNGDSYVKRVLGLPGERVALRDGFISITDGDFGSSPVEDVLLDRDGAIARGRMAMASHTLVEERTQGRTWMAAHFRGEAPGESAFTVPTGQFFVLGDNRAESADSRQPSFGMVPVESVEGRVTRILWSRGEGGFRSDRWLIDVE